MAHKICGIYQIRNTVNGKIYIGSSRDIGRRFGEHRYELGKYSHKNIHLQLSWNKHGADSFVFEKIEDVNRSQDLIRREQWYLDNEIRWGIDYNISKHADTPMRGCFGKENPSFGRKGENSPNWGSKRSAETREKMSVSQSGSNNAMWGRKASGETKKRMSKSNTRPNASLSREDVLRIRKLFDSTKHLSRRDPERYTQTKLAKMFGVSRSGVKHVINKTSWSSI